MTERTSVRVRSMTEPFLPNKIADWNGREITVATTRRGVTAIADASDNVIRGGVDPWPPPELVQKAYQSRHVQSFDEQELTGATGVRGFYSDLQSINSEDALTWSVFGPLVYGTPESRQRFSSELLTSLEVPLASAAPTHIWLWRRLPHPDTLVPGGPEIDVGMHVGDTVVYAEVKWRSSIGTAQGVAGDRNQIELRQQFCQKYGEKLYPGAKRFVVLGIAPERGMIPRADESCGAVEILHRSTTWSELAALTSLPHQAEFQRYLDWKTRLSSAT
jgi:hypothetical protein